MQQVVEGLGAKYIDYSYDLLGNVTKVGYQEAKDDQFIHLYAYNKNSQLTSVSTLSAGATIPVEQASYEYAIDGSLEKRKLSKDDQTGTYLEEEHYVYTLHGQLKAINPEDMQETDLNAGGNHVFSMAFDYYYGDYTAANGSQAGKIKDLTHDLTTEPEQGTKGQENYIGNIAAQRWKTRADFGTSNFTGYFASYYRYTHRNELDRSLFGHVIPTGASNFTGEFNITPDYRVFVTEYDKNGNIIKLRRDGEFSGEWGIDNLTYHYDTDGGKNKLRHIKDVHPNNLEGDLEDQPVDNYSYDAIGQMTEDVTENIKLVYDVYGKVIEVRDKSTNVLKVVYKYGADGQRTKKTGYKENGSIEKTTYYVRDVNGRAVSQYLSSPSNPTPYQTELSLYGAGRIGTGYKVGTSTAVNFRYELTDHLGSVRAVISRDGNGDRKVNYYADYYPFGWELPGRTAGSYRYGFQGEFAEKDPETGWNAFELRMYDSRIARWTAPDPYEEFWSPYLAMGNNPVNLTDPSGGMTDDPIAYSVDLASFDVTVTAERTFSNKLFDFVTANRFEHWRPTGTGAGLSVNPNFPQYSKFANDVANITYGFLEPVLTSIAPVRAVAGINVRSVFRALKPSNIIKRAAVQHTKKLRAKSIQKSVINIVKVAKTQCFTAGTKILTEEGLKSIEEIEIGDKVWAFNEETGKKELKVVTQTFVREANKLIIIKIGKEIIETTEEHPFYVNSKWVKAKDLVVGDLLFTFKGETKRINNLNSSDTSVIVYNFEVETHHNYFVGNDKILVHNTCGDGY